MWILIAVASGAALVVLAVAYSALDWIRARRWRQIPCVVLTSQAFRMEGGHYTPKVVYEYEVDGRVLRSESYSLAPPSSPRYPPIATLVDHYPPRRRTVCFVDPVNPARAVLDRSTPRQAWILLVPMTTLLIGLAGIAAALR